MNEEFEYELTTGQWETLKSLRTAASPPAHLNRFTLQSLIALGLAAMRGDLPVITPEGRKVLVRGSSQLLDLAA